MKNLDQIKKGLLKGKTTVYDAVSKASYGLGDEKDASGVLTGFKTEVARGGRVSIKVAENVLLSGLQSLAVRKGLTTFGFEAFALFGKTDFETFQTLYPEFKTDGFIAVVKRYLRQLGKLNVTTIETLSDADSYEVISIVCTSKVAIAETGVLPTDEERESNRTARDNFNEAKRAELAELAAKLKAETDANTDVVAPLAVGASA